MSWKEAFESWCCRRGIPTDDEKFLAEQAYGAGRDCGLAEAKPIADHWSHALYIGDIDQFKGRTANVVAYEHHVMAQFDTGAQWETHSRLNFPMEDWEVYDESQCDCHERDSSFTCSYCKRFGYYGHLEKPESD